MGFNEIRMFPGHALEQGPCFVWFSKRGINRSQVIVRILIARAQLNRARQIPKSIIKELVLSKQCTEIEVSIEVVRIGSQLVFESGFGLFTVSHPHQRSAIPGAQRRQLGIQFNCTFEFFDGPMTIISQQENRSHEQPSLGGILIAKYSIDYYLAFISLAIADKSASKEIRNGAIRRISLGKRRQQLDDLLVFAQANLTVRQETNDVRPLR